MINAGNTDVDLAHFDQVLAERFADKDVRYEVMQGRALVALQGPQAMNVLQRILSEDLTQKGFMSIFEADLDLGFSAIIARCGYTGKLPKVELGLTLSRRGWLRDLRCPRKRRRSLRRPFR